MHLFNAIYWILLNSRFGHDIWPSMCVFQWKPLIILYRLLQLHLTCKDALPNSCPFNMAVKMSELNTLTGVCRACVGMHQIKEKWASVGEREKKEKYRPIKKLTVRIMLFKTNNRHIYAVMHFISLDCPYQHKHFAPQLSTLSYPSNWSVLKWKASD